GSGDEDAGVIDRAEIAVVAGRTGRRREGAPSGRRIAGVGGARVAVVADLRLRDAASGRRVAHARRAGAAAAAHDGDPALAALARVAGRARVAVVAGLPVR